MKATIVYATVDRARYTYIILIILVIAIIVGLFTSSPGMFIRQFSASLIVIMIAAAGFTVPSKSPGMAAHKSKGAPGLGLSKFDGG